MIRAVPLLLLLGACSRGFEDTVDRTGRPRDSSAEDPPDSAPGPDSPPPDDAWEDVALDGTPIPSPTGPAGATGCEAPGQTPYPGSGPGPCGSYAVAADDCTVGLTGEESVTNAWEYILEEYPNGGRAGNSLRFPLSPRHAMIWKIPVGAEGSFEIPRMGGVVLDEQYNRGPYAAPFMALSERPCDFDYERLDAGDGCYHSESGPGAILFQVLSEGEAPFPYCTLRPSSAYYFSVRFEDATRYRGEISCDPSTSDYPTCGFVFQVQ